MANGSAPGENASDFDQKLRFCRAPGVLWRQLAGMILVRTVTDPQIIELSGTGLLLWLALIEPVTAGELVGDLATVLGAPPDIVADDVRAALADLMSRGVVTQLEVV